VLLLLLMLMTKHRVKHFLKHSDLAQQISVDVRLFGNDLLND